MSDIKYVLVLNCGSSSIKFQLVDPTAHAQDDPYVSGLVEQIGEPLGGITLKHHGEKNQVKAEIPNHTVGLSMAFNLMKENGVGLDSVNVIAVGHRTVHGGAVFSQPVVITSEVMEKMRALIPLAPLHNPANIQGIEVAQHLLPDVPNVAVFDTGFFHDLPEAAYTYAIDQEVAKANHIRRYGFHGTSHEYVSTKVAELEGRPLEELNTITLHLGNGASCSAVKGGRPMDTSMGMTPLAGLVMGTRSGDIDPGIIFHLARTAHMGVDELDKLLNRSSGVKGICGDNDFRDLEARMEKGDPSAILAFDVYITQLRRFLGSYIVTLGHVDTIVFTAGVGENDEGVRARALEGLEDLGIKICPERNAVSNSAGPRLISTDDSAVHVYVIPTNEELAIARKAAALV